MKESAEKLNNHALILAKEGKTDDALVCLRRACVLEPENAVLWFNLGITLRDNGNAAESRTALEKAHELKGDDEEILDALAIACMNAGDRDAAMMICAEGLTKNEMNPRIWNTFGVLYFQNGELDLACEAFEHAVTINPYYYDALFNLRDTYDELGNEDGKNRCIRQMQEIKSSSE